MHGLTALSQKIFYFKQLGICILNGIDGDNLSRGNVPHFKGSL
ncbi:MAG: hypothetical protein ACU85E_09890 [Gammaproteobacteria bacterium]